VHQKATANHCLHHDPQSRTGVMNVGTQVPMSQGSMQAMMLLSTCRMFIRLPELLPKQNAESRKHEASRPCPCAFMFVVHDAKVGRHRKHCNMPQTIAFHAYNFAILIRIAYQYKLPYASKEPKLFKAAAPQYTRGAPTLSLKCFWASPGSESNVLALRRPKSIVSHHLQAYMCHNKPQEDN